jgi:spore maturation protein CgeB
VKILCVLGEHNYGNAARGAGYEYVNFLPALRNLGHVVTHFESFSRQPYADFADMNRQLLRRVQAEKPDLILFVLLGYEVWLETLQLIRDGSNARLVNWSTDDSWKYTQFSKYIAPAFHLYATTYPRAMQQAVQDGHTNFFLSQWAANPSAFRPVLAAEQCRYQVSFVGTAYGNRPKWVAGLAARGIDVQCFGFGWPNGPVAAQQIPEIIQNSVISLNFGDSGIQWRGLIPGRSRQIKARLFEVPGAGGFLMSEAADGLELCFLDGEEIVSFNGLSDLAEKIHFYLGHTLDRDRIAQAGHARARLEHSYEARFQPLLSAAVVGNAPATASAERVDMEAFEAFAKRHRVGPGLALLRKLLLWPFVALWGKDRGPRAARRFLFELSWRVAGAKTYTASGWPGRLFYWAS